MAKKAATKKQRERWERVRALGCYVGVNFPEVNDGPRGACQGYVNIHHKLGEGRNHDKVIPLCTNHHVAWTPLGFGYSIHNGGKTFAKRYASEDVMIKWTEERVENDKES